MCLDELLSRNVCGFGLGLNLGPPFPPHQSAGASNTNVALLKPAGGNWHVPHVLCVCVCVFCFMDSISDEIPVALSALLCRRLFRAKGHHRTSARHLTATRQLNLDYVRKVFCINDWSVSGGRLVRPFRAGPLVVWSSCVRFEDPVLWFAEWKYTAFERNFAWHLIRIP